MLEEKIETFTEKKTISSPPPDIARKILVVCFSMKIENVWNIKLKTNYL